MKKLITIFFISTLAFSVFGYQLYFSIAENYSNVLANSIIESKNFNSEDLVSYKFSAEQLPYYSNNENYEAANGEVEVNGIIMNYVKKRIFNDSIEFVCLPNFQKTEVCNARDKFLKLVNDLNNLSNDKSQKKQHNQNFKHFSFEALALKLEKNNRIFVCSNLANKYAVINIYSLPKPYQNSSSPPPDFI